MRRDHLLQVEVIWVHWASAQTGMLAILVLSVVGAASAPSDAQQAAPTAHKTQARTAAAHASFAADGGTASYVREHMGHVLACLEGPKGKHVSPYWENPCQGQGNGVLVDLGNDRDGAAWMLVAQAADDLAVAGLKADALPQARQAARGVAALMKLVADSR